MPEPIENKVVETKVPAPAPSSGANADEIDFEKEADELERTEQKPPAPAAGKTAEEERKQAEFTLKSTAKRLKELGGDPTAALAGSEAAAPATPVPAPIDTSRFATKEDLVALEVRKLSRSEGEFRVIMHYVKKGLSVSQSHLLANEKRVTKALSEVTRSNAAITSPGGGGAGADRPVETEAPALSDTEKNRLIGAGMRYDPTKKAWVGKKVQQRWDGKAWVTEKLSA